MRTFFLWLIPVFLIALGITYAFTGPYVYPTSFALGPCFKDWTSLASYSDRVSPMDRVRFQIDDANVQICYSRPSARGRVLFGTSEGLVRYGRLWRTGANEPTLLFTDTALQVGDLTIPAGRYSLYTLPGSTTWDIHLNRSTFHWGNALTEDVLAQEIGRTTVATDSLPSYIEQFRIEPIGTGTDTALLLAWGNVGVRIPLAVAIP